MVGTVCPTASCPRKTCSSVFTICSFEGLSSGLEHVLKAKLSVIIIIIVIIFFTFFKQYFKIVFKETVFQHTCECSKPSQNSKKQQQQQQKKKKKIVISVPVVFCFTAQGWAQLCLIFITEKNHIKRTVKLNFCPANCFIPFS